MISRIFRAFFQGDKGWFCRGYFSELSDQICAGRNHIGHSRRRSQRILKLPIMLLRFERTAIQKDSKFRTFLLL